MSSNPSSQHAPENQALAPAGFDVQERAYVPELLKGLVITSKHFLRNLFGTRDPNPEVIDRKGLSLVSTIQYPEEKAVYPPGYRGLHRLVPREDGKPRCVACYMCATICPAQCIHIEAGETNPEDTHPEVAVIEKYPTQFVIDELRCIVCGLCVDACPKDAIRMDTYRHTPSEYNRQGFVYDIPKLLTGASVSHPSDPWFKRGSSEQPAHPEKEAHTRVDDARAAGGTDAKREVDTSKPVAITHFLK